MTKHHFLSYLLFIRILFYKNKYPNNPPLHYNSNNILIILTNVKIDNNYTNIHFRVRLMWYTRIIDAWQGAEKAFYRADLSIKHPGNRSYKLSGDIYPRREGLMPFSVELLIMVTGHVKEG